MDSSKFIIVEAPNESKLTGKCIKVFIAGGISNCPDWQTDLISRLKKDKRLKNCGTVKILIFNPRRKNKPRVDETEAQVTWEFFNLNKSDIISFWFSEGSLNPIVLFEYGRILAAPNRWKKSVIVGCHEKYGRRTDVIIQTKLIEQSRFRHPEIEVKNTFEDFANELIESIVNHIIRHNFIT